MYFTRELSKATVMMMHTDTGECATHVQIGTHISDPIRPVKFSHTESQTPSNTHTPPSALADHLEEDAKRTVQNVSASLLAGGRG